MSSLPLRLAEAQNHQLSAAQFLELVLQDELNVRHQRELTRRQSAASFRESRALEGFDFSFNSSINRQQVYELASCHFILKTGMEVLSQRNTAGLCIEIRQQTICG